MFGFGKQELIVMLILFICGLGSAYFANKRGKSGCLWFTVGFILGPVGLLINIILMLIIGEPLIRCPYCKSKVHKDASICLHCQKEIN